MLQLNEVRLSGHVATIPKTIETSNGKRKTTFRFATDEGYGEKKRTTFHNITAWGTQSEFVEKYIDNGKYLYIDGKINNYDYDDKDGGAKRHWSEVVAWNIQFPDKKTKSENETTELDNNNPEEPTEFNTNSGF